MHLSCALVYRTEPATESSLRGAEEILDLYKKTSSPEEVPDCTGLTSRLVPVF